MAKVLIAVRRRHDGFTARLAQTLSNLPGLSRWTLEEAPPGQDLLVAAGLRFDGRAIYEALLWCWTEEPEAPLSGLDPLCDVGAVLQLDERPGWDHSDDGGEVLGAKAVKMVSFVVRRPGVERRKFERDYAEHVAVARVHHPGVWRYVQNIVTRGSGEGADGVEAVSELWYRSSDDFLTRFYANDDSPRVVKTDNEEYIDFARTRSLVLTTSLNGVA
jgi:hypothetical protein